MLIILLISMVVVSGCVGQNSQSAVNLNKNAAKNNLEIKYFEQRSDGSIRITNCYSKSCQNPVFSFDSKEVLFTRFLNGYNKGPSELVKMDLFTGKEAVIVKADGDNVNVPYGSWIDNKITFASESGLSVVNSDGSDLLNIVNNENVLKIEPVFNPSNTSWIVFENVEGVNHFIKLVDSNSGKEFYLTHDVKYDDRLPSWSQDGEKILWQRIEIGKDDWKIYTADIVIPTSSSPSTLDPRLENVKQLTNGPDDTDNSWTWDGDILSSRKGDGKVPNIFLLSSGIWHRVTNSDKEDGAASQSPDKKWVGFESHIGDENSQSEIWIIKNSIINEFSNNRNILQSNNLPDLSDRNIQIPKIELVSSFQLQFAGEFDKSIDADFYDLDLYGTNKSVIEELHSKGKRVVCYINVGAWEDWREDKDMFPNEIIGKDYVGWAGEKWLDIRQIDKLSPIMTKRFDVCKEKGFDGIEPDNINGFGNPTGFQLTYEDQLRYNKWLSDEAHSRGLSIGLKNDGEQVNDLAEYFDFAVIESCFADNFCGQFNPFSQSGKPVFMIEYTDTGAQKDKFCTEAKRLGFSGLLKNRNLDAWIGIC